jgi:hypothetical protein
VRIRAKKVSKASGLKLVSVKCVSERAYTADLKDYSQLPQVHRQLLLRHQTNKSYQANKTYPQNPVARGGTLKVAKHLHLVFEDYVPT